MSKRAFGYIKDHRDDRDYDIRQLVVREVTLPPRLLVNEHTPIYNQGMIPKCVASCLAGVKTDQEFLERGEQIPFDDDWLYAQCKKLDGYAGEGTEIRFGLKVMSLLMKERGKPCPRRQWHIDGYYRILPDNSVNFVKQVLVQYGSIAFGSEWPRSWEGLFDVFPRPSGPVDGGHAYRIGGYWDDPEGFVIDNSWGLEDWGTWDGKGRAIMPFDIFTDTLASGADCWKIVDHMCK